MSWTPRLDLAGDLNSVKVNATDVEQIDDSCPTFWSAKIRRKVQPRYWTYRYSPEPFLLRPVREISVNLQGALTDPYAVLHSKVVRAVASYSLPPGPSRWVIHAVEAYLDAHEALVAQAGADRFVDFDPEVGRPPRVLSVWAPMYESSNGVREIRRFRLNSANGRPPASNDGWAVVAAFIAATTGDTTPVTRVRVVEVGLTEGDVKVVFDDTPTAAVAQYNSTYRSAVADAIVRDGYSPSRDCSGCKLAGICPASVNLDGSLGQDHPGIGTRSVSASDLDVYSKCPARWLMEKSLHLPQDDSDNDAATRGRLVHSWLERVHGRGVKCDEADIPDPSVVSETYGLSVQEYTQIRPFVAAHIPHCPLGPSVRIVQLDAPLYGYDPTADVVIAVRPDAVLFEEDVLVIRETKTTGSSLPTDASEAYDRWSVVAWLISLLEAGYKDKFGATKAVVELEVLTDRGGSLFGWDLDEPAVVRMARSDVSDRANDWHHDATWPATPGPQCEYCPVRRWCPDAEAPPAKSTAPRLALYDEPIASVEDPPPF